MENDKIIELISLALTAPTMVGALAVVLLWSPSLRKVQNGRDWILLGVIISFVGQFLDNGYWGMAWTLEFLEHPWQETVFQYGALANIPSRQIAGTAAAYCHLKAFCEITDSPEVAKLKLWTGLAVSLLVGLVAAMVLVSVS